MQELKGKATKGSKKKVPKSKIHSRIVMNLEVVLWKSADLGN